jgi:hypothetical protein
LSTQHEDPNNPCGPAAGISGSVFVNHLWPVVAGGGVMKNEALKLAKSWFEANTYGDEAVEVYEAIEQALAAQPAPVAWTLLLVGAHNGLVGKAGEKFLSNPEHYQRVDVYTAPPAAQPAVPDAIHHTDLSEHPQYIEGWNDCRAEMLKGMK